MNTVVDKSFRASLLIEDDFMPATTAAAMRAAIEDHLGDPYRHTAESRMAWNYFYVAGLYAYLRASPERVIGAELANAFQDRLADWSTANFGLVPRASPYLGLYIHGCRNPATHCPRYSGTIGQLVDRYQVWTQSKALGLGRLIGNIR